MKIEGFKDEFRFLSNFWPSEIRACHITFPTVEHAYQALKSPHLTDWIVLSHVRSPGEAKRRGKSNTLRPSWERLKVPTMRMLLRKKFQIPELREALIATHPFHLEETNHWGDTFWGVCKGVGENHLGKLLMQVRKEIHDRQ